MYNTIHFSAVNIEAINLYRYKSAAIHAVKFNFEFASDAFF